MITNKSTVFDILTGIYEKKQKIMLYYYGRDTGNITNKFKKFFYTVI